jgi:predicted PurR-regulated permease PerM
LYPAFLWVARLLGGRRKLAAVAVTFISLLVFTGPIVWLGLSMVDGVVSLSQRLNAGAISVPPPPDEIKNWPFVGEPLHHFWILASTNLKDAFTEALPYLQPLRSTARKMAEGAATGIPTFLISLIIAGVLFPAAPALLDTVRRLSQRILPAHGQEFLKLTGATIRNVSQGVIGIALLQAILAGLGFLVAGVPGAGFLALGILITGIIQFPVLVFLPVLIWSWVSMPAPSALALTAYLVPVALINNFLSPIVMAHGLKTPMIVIFIGVMGGAVAHGIIGLFLGPIVLAVTWELISAWLKHEERPPSLE